MFSLYEYKICPLIVKYANSEAGTRVNSYINSEIIKIIKQEQFNVNEINDINYNKNNQVSSVNINTTKLNEIKSKINLNVQNLLSNDNNVFVDFPIGNAFNSVYLVGVGPNINLKIKINSSVVTDVRSEFKTAGINQTLHSVVIDVKNNVCIMMPLFRDDVDFKTSIVISETVIVGDVPDSFTEVNDFADGKIADYIANYTGE